MFVFKWHFICLSRRGCLHFLITSFHVVERTRTTAKCTNNKSCTCKACKQLLFTIKYANLWRHLTPSSSGLLKLPFVLCCPNIFFRFCRKLMRRKQHFCEVTSVNTTVLLMKTKVSQTVKSPEKLKKRKKIWKNSKMWCQWNCTTLYSQEIKEKNSHEILNSDQRCSKSPDELLFGN